MKHRWKLDFATLLGASIAIAGIAAGFQHEGVDVSEIMQVTAALIVFGGTAGAVLVSMPGRQIRVALNGFREVLFEPSDRARDLVDAVIAYSRAARSSGLVSLDETARRIGDPVLRKAMRLAVDSVGNENIQSILEIEIRGMQDTAETAAEVYEAAAGYAPAMGMAGAALGLVQVMKHLENMQQVGAGIASAFVATIYGVLVANLILLPIATKIRTRCFNRVRICRAISEGVLAIASGLNPVLIRMKLEALLQIPEPPKNPPPVPDMRVEAAQKGSA